MNPIDHGSNQCGPAYLRTVLSVLLGTASFLAVGVAQAQSYCNSGGCVVYPPSSGGGSGPGGQGGGGGWGGGGNTEDGRPQPPPDPQTYCPFLMSIKPQSCPNPIPHPRGYEYGQEAFPSGTAMARAIYYINHQPGVSDQVKARFREALEIQTWSFSARINPFSETMGHVTKRLTDACDMQLAYTAQISPVRSTADKNCLEIVDQVIAESNNRQSFWQWFVNWNEEKGIDLSDLGIPRTIINLIIGKNSVFTKYNKVTDDELCSSWWEEVQYTGCSVP